MTRKLRSYPGKTFKNEYSPIHLKSNSICRQSENERITRSTTGSIAETINGYYRFLDASQKNRSLPEINDCFVVRLASIIIDVIEKEKFVIAKDGCFKDDFYRTCLEKLNKSDLAAEINDAELLIIYLKQCVHILVSSGILMRKPRAAARINRQELSAQTIFYKLFNAYWERTSWELIFPSDTEAARDLNLARNILKDLLIRRTGSINLASAINEFMEMTGFGSQNDLRLISFIDFYYITWLQFFGMLNYVKGPDVAPVRIVFTDRGRHFLRSI